jgi:ferritin-like metal-binding protein YciE
MSHANTLNDLFIEELQGLLNGEEQLIEALPQLADAATSEDLREGLETHLNETKEHARKLREILQQIGAPAEGAHCVAMEGLLKAGAARAAMEGSTVVRDAALIVAAQRVEHFEIAGYGSARTFARLLGHEDYADILGEIEDQEADTDKILTEVADTLNEQALVEST